MILVQLLGGLGNQMFQYAAGRALAYRTGTQLLLDVRTLHHYQAGVTPRHYSLDAFSITGAVASRRVCYMMELRRRLHLTRLLRESSHAYNPEFERVGRNTYLIGYWQSERYFAPVADHIRQELSLSTSPAPASVKMLTEIATSESVSVHVRRGDYAADPSTNAFHGLMPPSYYQRAAEALLNDTNHPHFFVFSDEPSWARQHIHLPGPTTFVDLHGPDEPHEDLRLMSACQHHIIANSSFSWWGAWLANRPGKRVFAPIKWFQDASVDTSDVCPPEWIRL